MIKARLKVDKISKRNRILFSGYGQWYTPANQAWIIESGEYYDVMLDDARHLIKECREVNTGNDKYEMASDTLYRQEIDRLNAILAVYESILPDDLKGEVEYVMSEKAGHGNELMKSYLSDIEIAGMYDYRRATERELNKQWGNNQNWISYTANPLQVGRLWALIRDNKQDRIKSTGKDIRCEIAKYCDTVPIGMLPDEIKDHLQGAARG